MYRHGSVEKIETNVPGRCLDVFLPLLLYMFFFLVWQINMDELLYVISQEVEI